MTLRQRLELRASRVMALIPPRLQVRLSGRPPVEVDGQRLEPEIQLLLSLIERRGRPPWGELPLSRAREELRRRAVVAAQPAARLLAAVQDIEVSGGTGPLRARHYVPPGAGGRQP